MKELMMMMRCTRIFDVKVPASFLVDDGDNIIMREEDITEMLEKSKK